MGFACSTEHVGWKYEVSFCTYTTNITARVLYSSNMLNKGNNKITEQSSKGKGKPHK